LNNTEEVKFLLKGGNVMSKYFSIHENKLKEMITNDEFTQLKTNFTISDVDYSLHIENTSYDRFTIISQLCIKILVSTLDELCEFYDFLYHNMNNEMEKRNLIEQVPYNIDNDEIADKELYDKGKELLYTLKGCIFSQDYSARAMQENIDTLNFMDIKIKTNIIGCSIYELLLYLSIYQNEKYIDNTQNVQDQQRITLISENIAILKQNINIKIKIKRNKVVVNNQYNNDNVAQYKSDICAFLNTDRDAYRYEKKEDKIKTAIITDVLDNVDIIIDKKKNVIVQSVNSIKKPRKLKTLDKIKYHYVSFNNVIFSRKQNNAIVNFYLLRSKFNTKITNNKTKKGEINIDGGVNDTFQDLYIPSEFIDISIPTKFDGTSDIMKKVHKDAEIMVEYNYSNSNDKVLILTYDTEEIMYDLEIVLFNQNYFVPWVDKKYNKRVKRFIYFVVLNANLTSNIVQKHEKINKVNHIRELVFSMCLNFSSGSLSYINNINMFLYNNDDNVTCNKSKIKNNIEKFKYDLNLDEKFEIYDMFLISIIINYILITEYNDDFIFNFINRMRYMYNYSIVEQSEKNTFLASYKEKFIEFLKDVSSAFNLFGDLNLNIISGIRTQLGGGIEENLKLLKYTIKNDMLDLQKNNNSLVATSQLSQQKIINSIKTHSQNTNLIKNNITENINGNHTKVFFKSQKFGIVTIKNPKKKTLNKPIYKIKCKSDDKEYENDFNYYDTT
jgi:hypothetical protein